jgi:hypothetical protein
MENRVPVSRRGTTNVGSTAGFALKIGIPQMNRRADPDSTSFSRRRAASSRDLPPGGAVKSRRKALDDVPGAAASGGLAGADAPWPDTVGGTSSTAAHIVMTTIDL